MAGLLAIISIEDVLNPKIDLSLSNPEKVINIGSPEDENGSKNFAKKGKLFLPYLNIW